MKRIAVLSVHSCPLAALGGKETGGMNVYVREVSAEMGRAGLAVDVFTRSQNPHIRARVPLGRNARVIHLKAGPQEPVPRNELVRYLPEFTEGVLRFARENRLSYDLIHSHYWLSGCVGSELKRRWSAPQVHMFHTLGALKNSAFRKGDEKETKERILAEKKILKTSDAVIAPSPWEKEQMIRLKGGKGPAIEVIPCGVDLALFRPIPPQRAKRTLGLSQGKFILFVGRIDAIKGIDVLIRAIHNLAGPSPEKNHLGLIIIGGESDIDPRTENLEMRKLRNMVARLDLGERVAFWGPQRQDLLPYFYSAAEALVMPSRYESFGMVTLEAMACGTPVIASRVGGLQYTVEDGKTGFLIPEGDWKVMAERIGEIVACPSLRRKFTSAAIRKVKEYGWPNITRKILRLYEGLEDAPQKRRRD
jgi:D-inositol-3-phosphate glycosyltransferase